MSRNKLTNYPNGLSSFGVPVFGGYSKYASAAFGGRTWFVNANSTLLNADGWAAGNDANSGLSPSTPFLTMAKAFSVIDSGDVINFTGKIQEQLVTPVQVFDVWVNGCGNRPRDPDSTPDGGQYSAAEWKAPASGGVAAQATVRVLQQGWRFTNFLMRAVDVNAACIELVRNAASGDDERDASHAEILGCRFSGTGIGVKFGATSFTEIVGNTLIQDNLFQLMTTAIDEHSAGLQFQCWIENNKFENNTNDIVLGGYQTHVIGNVMSLAPTACIVLSGATGSSQVHGNYLPGTYADGALYAPGTGDNWNGNYASTGVTAAVPA